MPIILLLFSLLFVFTLEDCACNQDCGKGAHGCCCQRVDIVGVDFGDGRDYWFFMLRSVLGR